MKKFKSIGITLFCIMLLTGLNSCGPKKGLIGESKPASDPVTGVILKYNLEKGQALNYSNSSNVIQDMEQMGNQIHTEVTSEAQFLLTGKGKTDEGNFSADLKINELSVSIKSQAGDSEPDLEKIKGHSLNYIFSPSGKQIQLSDPDSIKISMGMMGGGEVPLVSQIKQVLALLPEKTIKISDTWTMTKIDTSKRNGMDVISNTETKYIAEAVEMIDGHESLKIIAEGTGVVDGSGNMNGMDMTLEGDIETKSTIYFDFHKGVLVKSEVSVFMEATIAISGAANMTIPLVTTTKATIDLVK